MNGIWKKVGAGVGTTAVVIGAAAGVLALSTSAASAAAQTDVKVKQTISGSSKSGHTTDTMTIANFGSATATHVNLQFYVTTSSGGFTAIATKGPAVCEVMPAIGAYKFVFACQVTPSLTTDHGVNIGFDFGGSAGASFTSVATVGNYVADSNLKNNVSTVTSWLGTRADLAVSGTVKPGSKTKHATAVTTVINRGPNAASSLDEEISVKGASGVLASGNMGNGCKIDSVAPTGYDFGVTCHLNSLSAGTKWILTFDYTGTSGKTITMKTNVSAFTPADPNTANNSMTKTVAAK